MDTKIIEIRVVDVNFKRLEYLNVSHPAPFFSPHLSARALRVSVRIRPRSRFC